MKHIQLTELESICGDLYRAADSLRPVWDDKQFDYFRETYISNVESELTAYIAAIDTYLYQFNALTDRIENL